jgi:hypothetical protein
MGQDQEPFMLRSKLLSTVLCVAGFFMIVCVLQQRQKNYPYGHRPAVFEVTASALFAYSIDNADNYPSSSNSYNALALLYPNYLRQDELAGLSGNSREVMRRLSNGTVLDGSVSSWVYWPGFRNDTTQKVAILWDKEPLTYGGRSEGVRLVLYCDGSLEEVSTNQWNAFTSSQIEIRAKAENELSASRNIVSMQNL